MSEDSPLPPSPVIDAYMHVGSPRFGTARQALDACDLWGTDRRRAGAGAAGARSSRRWSRRSALARGASGPSASPTARRPNGGCVCAEACLTAGAIGIRMQGDEPLENPAVMDLLGGNGRWIYATDPLASPRTPRSSSSGWRAIPQARLAAPHFLRPSLGSAG